MKKRKKFPALCLLILLLTALLSVPVSATGGYSDVAPGSDCYESVTYLAEQGITSGTGGNCYSPDDLITVRQWAVMLCRAYLPDTLPTASYESLGDACVRQCYREGWVTESAVLSRDSRMCRGALLQSALAAADIPVYDYSLYPGGSKLSAYDNVLRIGTESGLCQPDSGALDLMTRGDAAQVLYQLLTSEYEVEAPPLATAVFLYNKEGADLNPYLVEIQKIPASIREILSRQAGNTSSILTTCGILARSGGCRVSVLPHTAHGRSMYPPLPPPSTSSAISWIGHWISQHTMRNYTRRRPSLRPMPYCGTTRLPTAMSILPTASRSGSRIGITKNRWSS